MAPRGGKPGERSRESYKLPLWKNPKQEALMKTGQCPVTNSNGVTHISIATLSQR